MYICHTSFRKCKWTLLTRNIAHVGFKCGRNIKRTLHQSITLPYSIALLLSEFYLHCFGLQALLPIDTHTSSRRALKLPQEQKVPEDWRRLRNERQISTCCHCMRDFGIKRRESEGREVVLGTLLKLLVKDKLLHSGKVPVNAELRPLRREKRGTEVQRYGTLNEAMKM